MISGTLTQEQHLHALRLHRRKVVLVLVGVVLACAVIGVVTLATGHHFPGLILVCAGVGGAISAFAQSRLTLPRQVAKIHRQQASLHAHYTYNWDEEWLSVASEHVQAKRRWSDYTKLRENEEVLLLYHSDVMFEVVPKAWLNDQAQMNEFRRLASQAVGRAHRDSQGSILSSERNLPRGSKHNLADWMKAPASFTASTVT